MTTARLNHSPASLRRSVIPTTDGGGEKNQVSDKFHWLKPLAILCCLVNVSAADTFGLFTYTSDGSSITITDCRPEGVADIDIPASIVGKPVTHIGPSAFDQCQELTNITIPASVTSIGEEAFRLCLKLTTIAIPSGVTSIEKGTFSQCSSLTSVTIPSSVTSIGQEAFSNAGLTCVTIPGSVTTIGSFAFQGCPLAVVSIPNSVTDIGDSAFKYCTNLTSVVLSTSVTRIGNSVFQYCTSLPSITIPSSVTSIGQAAFGQCYSLTSVIIPASVTSIESGAFFFCPTLTSISFQGNAPLIGGSGLFDGTPITQYFRNDMAGFTTPTWKDRPSFPGVSPQFTSPTPPATGTIGTAYSHTCTAGNAPAPAFTVTAGALPTGVIIGRDGAISGAPTAAGIFNGTITASNGFPPDSTQGFSIDTRNSITITAYNGTVSGAGRHDPNSTVILTPTPNPGYVFSKWTGDATGKANPLSVVMDFDMTITAVFGPDGRDPDGDGLTNYQEIVVYGTNPNVADTDTDGYLDGYEVLTGKSPLDIGDHPALVAEARTAIEFTFPSAIGKTYRIEDSPDLTTWATVESGIAGNGSVIQRFYSTRNVVKRYFRVADETAP